MNPCIVTAQSPKNAETGNRQQNFNPVGFKARPN